MTDDMNQRIKGMIQEEQGETQMKSDDIGDKAEGAWNKVKGEVNQATSGDDTDPDGDTTN